jgi:DNA-binding response OmpR family regulator
LFLTELAQSVPNLFVIAPAQHGGIALLELLTDLDVFKKVKVVIIDPENDTRTAIKALRLGATDYFLSSMSPQEIQSRLRTLLHMNDRLSATLAAIPLKEPPAAMPAVTSKPIVLSDNFSVNANLRAIRKGDMWVSLSPIEWRLFEELIQNRGRVVNFEELVRRGLNRNRVTASETSLLRLHMSRLRAKLNAHFDRDLNIITLRGRGYMLA